MKKHKKKTNFFRATLLFTVLATVSYLIWSSDGVDAQDPSLRLNIDLDGDGIVGEGDYLLLGQNFGDSNPEQGDLNEDGSVDTEDLAIMMYAWQQPQKDSEVWIFRGASDYQELASETLSWPETRNIIDAIMVDISNSSDAQLAALAKLNDEGIDIVIQKTISKRFPSEGDCDSSPHAVDTIEYLEQAKASGVGVKYINLVEPLHEMTFTPKFFDIRSVFGNADDFPIVGNWDGEGGDNIGLYRAASNEFIVTTSNTDPMSHLRQFTYGVEGDVAISGDWSGDGVDTAGVYRASEKRFLLNNSGQATDESTDFVLDFANEGDIPITGDWDGDGVDTVGLYRPTISKFLLRNVNETGPADKVFHFGLAGDVAFSGDWDGDGDDTVGVYRGRDRFFYISNSTDQPGTDVVIYNEYGNPGDIPIAGDWDGDGDDTLGYRRPSGGSFSLINTEGWSNLCNYSPQQAAVEVRKFHDAIRAYDSSIIVGEVLTAPRFSIDEREEYFVSLEGEGVALPYAYVDFNLVLADNWLWDDGDISSHLTGLSAMFDRHSIEYGSIFYPSRGAQDDQDYYNQTMEFIDLVRDSIGVSSKVSFESWGHAAVLPSVLLPETDPLTFTGLVVDGWERLTVSVCGDGICGDGEEEACPGDCQE